MCKHDALRPLGSEEAEALPLEEADAAGDSPRPELSLPPFFFPIRRYLINGVKQVQCVTSACEQLSDGLVALALYVPTA